ncbi:MAG: glycosyltransferase family 2 protein [Oscillospiraceae bacterium]|nr:glycosyltransferase family 2 protein [Oscillospiraceae bacterium]
MSELISVIVPCYNESRTIEIFYQEITKISSVMDKYDFEYIFVDDGSKDDTLDIVKNLSKEDSRVKYISFSRNFGKESGIYAGLEKSKGDYAVVMDADLQDPPSLLPEMMRCIDEEGYDSVATRRVTRKGEPPIRSFFARQFYKLMNKISKTEIVDGARDYRLMTRQFVNAILQIQEYNRFSKGIYGWVGFNTKWLEYENVERVRGETKWSFWKLLVYAVDGIIAFSTVPLTLSVFFGLMFCFIALVATVYIVFKTILYGDPVAGWPSMMCIILMLGGIQLFCIGILGEYLSKTYLESKNRPIYICKETNT